MKNTALKRLLALALSATMVLGLAMTGVSAEGSAQEGLFYEKLDASAVSAQLKNTDTPVEEITQSLYAEDELVRVTIVMESQPALVQAGDELSLEQAQAQLLKEQAKVEKAISRQALDGQPLDRVWNLTLVSNAISANVEYGKIAAIEQVKGVAAVVLETKYMPLADADPTNIVAQTMTGANQVQATGYTGAGTRIAVIDTGVDTDHQSFAEEPFSYALSQLEGEYDLLDAAEIEAVLPRLHAYEKAGGDLTAQQLYISKKIPYGFNYIDNNLDVTHDNDAQGSHGSHVAGIAAANRYVSAGRVFDVDNVYDFDGDRNFDVDDVQALMNYIIQGWAIPNQERADRDGDGILTDYDAHLLLDLLEQDYISAAEEVGVSGVAPDAQLLAMKVFGAAGGAYDSDYMAAVEDAVLLGCDTINMSLGASWPGFSHSYTYQWYDQAVETLAETGVVLCVSAGNSYAWAYNDDAYGLMYADEVEAGSVTNPAGYANAMAVASAENVGSVVDITTVFSGKGETVNVVFTSEAVSSGSNAPWSSLDPEVEGADYETVFLGDPSALLRGEAQEDTSIYAGSAGDFSGYDFTGKVVLVARGNAVSFADKHMNAALSGAAAVIIYNNEPGVVYANLTGSDATIPCGMISREEAAEIFALCSKNDAGVYTAKLHVACGLNVDWGEGKGVSMSDFSSWGVIGDLSIKPDITAPGGGIYSVNGTDRSGSAYETMSGTSMASPHAAGIAALAIQYIRESGLADTEAQVRRLAQSLMMSTAKPVIEQETGVEYSVRKQGSGLASVPAIVAARSYVLVDGQPDGKVKAELGDGKQDRSFTFTIYNRSETETVFDLSASLLTPATVVEDGNALTDTRMEKLAANAAFSTGSSVTVPANGQAQVTVTISVPEEEAQRLYALGHTNGFFVEGYIYAAPRADEEGAQDVTHSIPLLGWYGSWSDPSMFDEGSYIEKYYGTQQRPSHITNAVDESGYALNTNQKNMLAWTIAGLNSGMAYSGNVYSGGKTASGEAGGDSAYIEARNAINVTSDAYWQFYGFFPTLIRNAVDADLFVTDDAGNELYRDDMEGYVMYANFYYTGLASWIDYTTSSGFTITDWSFASQLEDGTHLNIALGMLPEYYLSDEDYYSNFDYDSYYGDVLFMGYEMDDAHWTDGTLGEGCFMRTVFTVDNTAPDLAQALTLENGQLRFAVQDNEYVAAVILLDGNGRNALEYFYPDMPESARGTAVSGSFDLTDYAGERAVLAICDYAGNETYYAVNLNGLGESFGDLVAFQYGDGWVNEEQSWVSFTTDVNLDELNLYTDVIPMVCAEYVNGIIFAQDSNGKLYGIRYEDFLSGAIGDLESTYITKLENVYQDLAYSYREGKLYGLVTTEDEDGYPTAEVLSINLNGSYWDEDEWRQVEAYEETSAVSRGGLYGLGMAIDDEGTVYVLGCTYDWETEEMSETAHLWSVGLEYNEWVYRWQLGWRMEEIGDTGLPMDYLQSMTWNHNDETLYWAQFSDPRKPVTLQKVNPETAECTQVGTLSTETCAMFAPLTAETAAKDEHSNTPVFDGSEVAQPILSATMLTMNKNATETLSCTFEPWYSAHTDVVWSSSDESVATVNQKGKITAIGEGSCVITVANAEDESRFATCQVTVAALSLNIEGIVSFSDTNITAAGGSRYYSYQLDHGESSMELGALVSTKEIGEAQDISLPTQISAATMGRNGNLWAAEWGSSGMFYEIDPETMAVKNWVQPVGGDYTYGMTYAESLDLYTTIANYDLFVDLSLDRKMEEEMLAMDDFTQYHRLNLIPYLEASDQNFGTGENGNGSLVDVVLAGITVMEEPYTYESDYRDYLGQWDTGNSLSYTSEVTYVLLDNVGRLWYIDRIPGFKTLIMEYEDYDWETGEPITVTTTYYYTADTVEDAMYGEGMLLNSDYLPNGMMFLEDTDENGNGIATGFYIRELQETQLTNLYRNGTMPRYSYTFNDLYYVGKTEDGAPMFVLSLYDFWNSAKTNLFYLYVGGVATGEMGFDEETWSSYEICTPDGLYSLGDAGEYNVIATITGAEYIGGLPETEPAQPETYTTYIANYNYRQPETH